MPLQKKIVYVLSPYRHNDPAVVEARVLECERYCAYLFNKGFFPICTVSSGHQLTKKFNLTDDFAIWMDNCHALIEASGQVHVLMQDGWIDSEGLTDERKYCMEIEKHTVMVDICNGHYINHIEHNKPA